MSLPKIAVKKYLILILSAVLLTSCASEKKIIYLQNAAGATSESKAAKYENLLQPDDNLIITVTADKPELVNNYNLMYLNMRSTEMRTLNDDRLFTYLIDQNGEIDFPAVGKIKLAGLTRIQAEAKIKELLKDYVTEAQVLLRVLNFKVTVNGEVVRPGPQQVNGDRITIFEALSAAGDLTIYGNRQEVMVIREIDGVTTINEIDLTDANIINTPYYYLAHNDQIYVKPNKTRVNSSVVGPNITVIISAISLLIGIVALSTR